MENLTKSRGKPFPAGVSGNPKGRPRGSLNRTTAALRATLETEGAEIVRALVDEAKKGTPWAVKLSIDRLIRIRPDRFVELDLQAVKTAAEVARATAQVVMMAADGQISLEDAKALMVLLEGQRAAAETAEIAESLMRIEEQRAIDRDEELKRKGKYGL